jgi:hypothetical protein
MTTGDTVEKLVEIAYHSPANHRFGLTKEDLRELLGSHRHHQVDGGHVLREHFAETARKLATCVASLSAAIEANERLLGELLKERLKGCTEALMEVANFDHVVAGYAAKRFGITLPEEP